MRLPVLLIPLLCSLAASTALTQTGKPVQVKNTPDLLAEHFVSDFDLPSAAQEAEARLQHNPSDAVALFVRMETAELQERPELVLDSALRLCTLLSDSTLQEVASNRVLQHAGNNRAFTAVTRRVRAAAALDNACTFNLRLALVAAAMDGHPKIDLDQATRATGLLTRWRMAGPFGQYSNVDFDRRWPTEADQLSRQQYVDEVSTAGPPEAGRKKLATSADNTRIVKTERFWFRDGMLSLPDYFSGSGVFYAVGEIELPASQAFQLEVLSSGTYAVSIDGREALLHDSRYGAGTSRDSSSLRLGAGRHRILVKFTADAAPLSVALHPRVPPQVKKPELPQPLANYSQALAAYFRGDFVTMAHVLHADGDRNPGAAQYLRALLYSAAEDRSPRADAAWKAIGSSQPSALLARLKFAECASVRGQADEARIEVMNILAERPQSETALQLAFNLSRSQTNAPELMARLLELHPSCAHLAEAVKFYSSAAEQDKAAQLEQRLAICAPESLQYARVLAAAGRHSAAAAYLQELIARNPLQRAVRRLLVEQLVMANQQSAARLQAKQLHELAPDARNYARLADDPGSAQDGKSQRAAGFTQIQEFYVPYRRDGLELVQRSAQRNFSGGSAVVLLSDKVVQIEHEGAVSVYVHRITRPLNKDGIGRYGEIQLPRGADLLELRTIKSSGQVIEPELAQQKASISMPALEPGDAIEEEYVLHYPELEQSPESASTMVFGSFEAPVLHSRLVLLSSPDTKLNIREQAGAPQPLVGENNGMVIRIWERNNVPQTIAESFLPSTSLLPTVAVSAAEKTSDRLRDELFDATRTGLHASEAGLELQLSPASSEIEKAKRLYRFVTARIDSTGSDWAANPAEDTLQNGQGSRSSALLALARIAGLKAGLVLARKVDQSCSRPSDFSCYTEPLVRFWFANGETADVNAESDNLPFGSISPSLETREALLVPLMVEETKKPEIVTLAVKSGNEKSTAEGELSFMQNDLVADLQIRLGAARSQEIRSLLRNAGARERQVFFEQLAMRIFPEAASVTGSTRHESDPEQALELSLQCTVPQFISRQTGAIDIDQLVPSLGLGAQYAKTPARKFPLYIESLFFESTTFHLHLPAGTETRSVPADFAGKSEFGEYAVRFAHSARQIDIHREFHIPVQVIAPEKYAAFTHFARQIDEAERQRISLELGKDGPAAGQYRVPPATGMFR
jgi:tetratricopeptide (TPR) repeat protein